LARGESLFRQWELLKTLQAHRFGLSTDDLARRLECTRRTVQRDLDALRDLFPIQYEQRDFGKRFWKLSGRFIESNRLELTLAEMLSLYMSRQLLAPLAGTPFGDGIATALDKIKALLPTEALGYFGELDDAFFIKSMGKEDYSHMRREIATLNEAIVHCRIVRVDYHSASQDRIVHTRMHPYGMVLLAASLYCIGYLEQYREVRTLKVSRLRAVQVTDATFEKPESFSLRRYTAGSFGIFGRTRRRQIRVRFSDWAATNVREHKWHDSQEIVSDAEGVLVATFQLDSVVEFKRWLLGFGRHAVVEAPRALADEVAAELEAAAGNYPPSAHLTDTMNQ
jgi:proteasome accessory factor B